ncbi:hypothetical protein [Fervidobacterium nodosum]|uniref:Uncharacterized protein n=1 Tax=Fervidobacterium nodosum (strain ATCC 35602 / DSM 5306 / Rt17-B1) TaxID=381764 RepID=A7HMV8_FERNB|nr:hypothetical protein [Fervidobacterium nodosum]ABS61241.1 hypothetical protein Fnod_1395 [Fervidobacterium nodosum Rt17-B1]
MAIMRFNDLIIEIDSKVANVFLSDDLVTMPGAIIFNGKLLYKGRLPFSFSIKLGCDMDPKTFYALLHVKTVALSDLIPKYKLREAAEESGIIRNSRYLIY